MLICSLLHAGSPLSELDIFMQYYWKLAPQMGFIDADKLDFLYFEAGITDDEMKFIRLYTHYSGVCEQEIILIRMVNYLLNGNIDAFYKMLEILQSCGNPIIHHFVHEINVALGYKFSTGVYTNVLHIYSLLAS